MEHRDVIRCSSCGGKCCRLYIKMNEGGQLPDHIHYANDSILDQTQNFDYYFRHSIWHIQKDKFNVEPLFDVLEAYTAWIDSYIYDDSSVRKLKALKFLRDMNIRGINIGYCAYWTKERGCIIEWEKRPVNCKEHRCREWLEEEEEEAKHTNSNTDLPWCAQ